MTVHVTLRYIRRTPDALCLTEDDDPRTSLRDMETLWIPFSQIESIRVEQCTKTHVVSLPADWGVTSKTPVDAYVTLLELEISERTAIEKGLA